jgi:Rod binding domain-containing protein
MSKNAIYILSDSERLSQFKINAKRECKKFDIHSVVPKYESIYIETLKKSMILK